MRITIITPTPPSMWTGNRATSERWFGILQDLGHDVRMGPTWPGAPCDVMIALHARKSAAAIERFASEHPNRPIIVALTGTDVYGDLHTGTDVLGSLARARRIVTLQETASRELPERFRPLVRVIRQSVTAPVSPPPKRHDAFEVCVIGNLREVKDPFLTAEAARLLPDESRIRVIHVGAALDEVMERRAQKEAAANPRYRWVGPRPHEEALRTLAGSRLMVLTSKMEGGANVVSEAIVCGVPVISSHIPGSVGLLGEDYDGYFPVGDAKALATLLDRVERNPSFLQALTAHGTKLAPRFSPDREKQSWKQLLDEL